MFNLYIIKFVNIMDYLLYHQDYFINIIKYLSKQELNKLLLVNSNIYKNLEYCSEEYKKERIIWNKNMNTYPLFEKSLMDSLDKIKEEYQNQIYNIFSYNYYDGPLDGTIKMYKNV